MRCGSIGLSAGLSYRMPSPCCRCCQVIGGVPELDLTGPRHGQHLFQHKRMERDGSFLCTIVPYTWLQMPIITGLPCRVPNEHCPCGTAGSIELKM